MVPASQLALLRRTSQATCRSGIRRKAAGSRTNHEVSRRWMRSTAQRCVFPRGARGPWTEIAWIVARAETALVIHAKPDDMKSDPARNAGDRIACGVITK